MKAARSWDASLGLRGLLIAALAFPPHRQSGNGGQPPPSCVHSQTDPVEESQEPCLYSRESRKFLCQLPVPEGDTSTRMVSACVANSAGNRTSSNEAVQVTKILKPDPPANITVTAVAGHPQWLNVTWKDPCSWDSDFYRLHFELRYRAEQSRAFTTWLVGSSLRDGRGARNQSVAAGSLPTGRAARGDGHCALRLRGHRRAAFDRAMTTVVARGINKVSVLVMKQTPENYEELLDRAGCCALLDNTAVIAVVLVGPSGGTGVCRTLTVLFLLSAEPRPSPAVPHVTKVPTTDGENPSSPGATSLPVHVSSSAPLPAFLVAGGSLAFGSLLCIGLVLKFKRTWKPRALQECKPSVHPPRALGQPKPTLALAPLLSPPVSPSSLGSDNTSSQSRPDAKDPRSPYDVSNRDYFFPR
ncbi:interleukin-6 receptor subunit alpha [Fukomys damarensis]|uniref:interleukin-6 receptor subunit alpha n=1 Tax=Fukomys damarensis TaxID=885580 RepID=UPI0014559E5C|nr:interleukin-6 receptor subunit alpha [Fukomys damarensis]